MHVGHQRIVLFARARPRLDWSRVPIFGTWVGIRQNLRLGANHNGQDNTARGLDTRVQIRDGGN